MPKAKFKEKRGQREKGGEKVKEVFNKRCITSDQRSHDLFKKGRRKERRKKRGTGQW